MRTRLESVVTLPTDERGRQAFDGVHFRHADLLDQAPRVRRDRLEIAPLRFGVQRAECQRRFARSGHAGEDDQRIARNLHIDVFQIVFASAAHPYESGEDGFFGRWRCRASFVMDGVHIEE